MESEQVTLVCLEALAGLSVHRYQYDTEQFPHMGLPHGVQVGLLAQELEQVLPGLVTPGPLQGLLRNEGTLHIDEFSASSDLNDQSLIHKC
jgi:hypothetical protein